MKILRTNKAGTVDISRMIGTVTWSGDYKSVARSLEFEMACSATDESIPKVSVELGDKIAFYADAQLFDGFVFCITKGSADKTLSVKCYDRGVYLGNNQGYYKFANAAPEEIAAQVAGDFGIPCGEIAATGYRLTRNFMGVALYQIIATAYTMAAGQTGVKYHVGFDLDRLTVREKKQDAETLVIRGGSNLLTCEVTETIESMVNRVLILDDSYSVQSELENSEDVASYGLIQHIIQASDSAQTQAQAVLDDGGPAQKITLECIGDTRSITGRMVAVYEPHTGVWGLFWIDSDVHTWRNGVYTNKLVVNLKNVMNEVNAGTEAASRSGTATKTGGAATESKGTWAYYREE